MYGWCPRKRCSGRIETPHGVKQIIYSCSTAEMKHSQSAVGSAKMQRDSGFGSLMSAFLCRM